MKLIVNAVAAIGLFAGTLAGLLAATGRLNHDGTKNIPLIGSFFPELPGAKQSAAGAGGTADAQGKGAQGEQGKQGPAAGETTRPKEPPVLKRGRSLFEEQEQQAGAGAQGGKGETGREIQPRESGAPAATNAITETRQAEKDFQQLEQQLAGDRSAYQPGSFFRFEGMPSGISAEKLNEAWQRVQQQLGELDKRKATQDQREQDLVTLEQDLSRRQVEVGRERTRIEAMQKELDTRIELFQQQVRMVRLDEVAGLKKNATTLASFEPSKAAELVQEQWKTEAGQDLVLKTLEVMDKDAANAILAALPNGVIRDVLERRLRLVREQSAGAGR